MQVRLKRKTDNSIHVSEMKDGDLAVICESWQMYAGRIVQRIGDVLYTIGKSEGCHWKTVLKSTEENNPNVRVELLTPGDELVLEE